MTFCGSEQTSFLLDVKKSLLTRILTTTKTQTDGNVCSLQIKSVFYLNICSMNV